MLCHLQTEEKCQQQNIGRDWKHAGSKGSRLQQAVRCGL